MIVPAQQQDFSISLILLEWKEKNTNGKWREESDSKFSLK